MKLGCKNCKGGDDLGDLWPQSGHNPRFLFVELLELAIKMSSLTDCTP